MTQLDVQLDPAFPLKELRLFHRNARKGDVEAIKRSINANGFFRTVVVNKGTYTGRTNEVLCGNHSVKALRDLGHQTVPISLVDVDEDQAARIVLVDNKVADDASYDVEVLTGVLSDLPDLDGTGFSEEELDKLLNGLETGEEADPHDSEHEEDYHSKWEIVVECDGEEQQRELYAKFMEEGLTCRVLSL